MRVSVDFDGTITQNSTFGARGFNKIRPDCKETMDLLTEMGVQFVLLTGRLPEWIPEAVQLCKQWGLPIDTSTPNTKTISDYYIDDRNIGCKEIDWVWIYRFLRSRL